MTRITPPRKPKGEDPADTIAMQDRQINMLINRIEQLTGDLAESHKEKESVERSWTATSDMIVETSHRLDKVSAANTRLLGYQDCAREVIQMMLDSK